MWSQAWQGNKRKARKRSTTPTDGRTECDRTTANPERTSSRTLPNPVLSSSAIPVFLFVLSFSRFFTCMTVTGSSKPQPRLPPPTALRAVRFHRTKTLVLSSLVDLHLMTLTLSTTIIRGTTANRTHGTEHTKPVFYLFLLAKYLVLFTIVPRNRRSQDSWFCFFTVILRPQI